MVRAKCPFCGEENHVGLGKVRPEPTAMMKTCSHYVLFGTTRYMGAEYAEEEFDVNFGTTPGSYNLDASLVRILNGYFKFVGPVAFAPSGQARDDARRAVEDFLKARKLGP